MLRLCKASTNASKTVAFALVSKIMSKGKGVSNQTSKKTTSKASNKTTSKSNPAIKSILKRPRLAAADHSGRPKPSTLGDSVGTISAHQAPITLVFLIVLEPGNWA